eukprot:COSAG01_NODE_9864_length_2318_cov_4.567823_2_plen_433_part_00
MRETAAAVDRQSSEGADSGTHAPSSGGQMSQLSSTQQQAEAAPQPPAAAAVGQHDAAAASGPARTDHTDDARLLMAAPPAPSPEPEAQLQVQQQQQQARVEISKAEAMAAFQPPAVAAVGRHDAAAEAARLAEEKRLAEEEAAAAATAEAEAARVAEEERLAAEEAATATAEAEAARVAEEERLAAEAAAAAEVEAEAEAVHLAEDERLAAEAAAADAAEAQAARLVAQSSAQQQQQQQQQQQAVSATEQVAESAERLAPPAAKAEMAPNDAHWKDTDHTNARWLTSSPGGRPPPRKYSRLDGDTEAVINRKFREFDADGNGWISLAEVFQMASYLELKTTYEAIVSEFHDMDHDGDGRVSLDEFKSWYLKDDGGDQDHELVRARSYGGRLHIPSSGKARQRLTQLLKAVHPELVVGEVEHLQSAQRAKPRQ